MISLSGLIGASGGAGGQLRIFPVESHGLAVFWTELAALLLMARALGSVARRLGQPAVVGELVAGLLLGPSVLGKIWPSGFD